MELETPPAPVGVKMNLVSGSFLDPMPSPEKIRFILDEVEAGKVLVLERGLTPVEEAKLIEATMADIQQDRFTGIEMQTYTQEPSTAWSRFFSGRAKPRMVVIGPASTLKTLSKGTRTVEAVIVAPAPGS